jgi:HSP20 family protein
LKSPLESAPRDPHIVSIRAALRFEVFQHRFQQEFDMTIVSYEPWAFVNRLHRQFERASGESAASADSANVSWIPRVDVREEAERFVVAADVPGVEGKDIEITADKGVLTIKGERRSEKKASEDGFERVERASGTFLRRFTLPESADAEAIKATHTNGVLEVTIPKRPQEQPRRISVQAA